jgi:hypothetical protein
MRHHARLCVTFSNFPQLWFATLRDFFKTIANDCKITLNHMTSLLFVDLRPSATFPAQPSATFRNFGPRL